MELGTYGRHGCSKQGQHKDIHKPLRHGHVNKGGNNQVGISSCLGNSYISSVIKERSSLLVRTPESFKNIYAVDVLTKTMVENIDQANRRLDVLSLEKGVRSTLEYDKLVLSTGASPILPRFEGINLAGIYNTRRYWSLGMVNLILFGIKIIIHHIARSHEKECNKAANKDVEIIFLIENI